MAGCQQGKSLYIAIISRQLRRLGDAAPMAGKSVRDTKFNTDKRTRKNALKHRRPDSMNYKDVDLSYKEPYTFHFERLVDRPDIIKENKELVNEYKNRLEHADYSSFKLKDLPDLSIAKFEERDAVSFYAPLARMMRADRLKMSEEEYTKKLREFKSGKFEHGIFVN